MLRVTGIQVTRIVPSWGPESTRTSMGGSGRPDQFPQWSKSPKTMISSSWQSAPFVSVRNSVWAASFSRSRIRLFSSTYGEAWGGRGQSFSFHISDILKQKWALQQDMGAHLAILFLSKYHDSRPLRIRREALNKTTEDESCCRKSGWSKYCTNSLPKFAHHPAKRQIFCQIDDLFKFLNT